MIKHKMNSQRCICILNRVVKFWPQINKDYFSEVPAGKFIFFLFSRFKRCQHEERTHIVPFTRLRTHLNAEQGHSLHMYHVKVSEFERLQFSKEELLWNQDCNTCSWLEGVRFAWGLVYCTKTERHIIWVSILLYHKLHIMNVGAFG